MLCVRCGGNGKYMGIGFAMRDCELCAELENSNIKTEGKTMQPDKRSKAYKDAINDLMKTNNMSKRDATKLFDETYARI